MTPHSGSATSRLTLVLLCVVALMLPGCRGCTGGQTTAQQQAAQKKKEEEEKKKKEEEEKERKKPPTTLGPVRLVPSQSDQPIVLLKPGHWTVVSQDMRRNRDDWVGQSTRTPVRNSGDPIPVDQTRFYVSSQRPVALSKGQKKQIESTIFVPQITQRVNLQSELRGLDSVVAASTVRDPTTSLLPHQYQFIVLASNPASYGKLGSLRSVVAPLPQMTVDVLTTAGQTPPRINYRVVAPELGDRAPLPDSLFHLTSVAYILWDEVNPETFDPAQQAALLDWLQWGGQLIVSGPDSLALLRGSFLEPYLPAKSGGSREIPQQELARMINAWGVGSRGLELKLSKPLSGIKLELVEPDGDRFRSDEPVRRATSQLMCGDLFAERRVGKGRVIVSAMQLNSRALQNWQRGFECLMNAVVMRRPPRRFRDDNFGAAGDGDSFTEDPICVEWISKDKYALDASYNSKLRLMARDTYANPAAAWRYRTATEQDLNRWGGNFPGGFGQAQQQGATFTTLSPPDNPGGVGGWDDFNEVSVAARTALREAAGVTVPSSSFVIACVGVYLLVLVPANWVFFRAWGRVEFAWLAAPLIAIAGTALVVKQAQLDIGFVSAQTEIALLETQPNYKRGCLTRYTALYTSLTSTYDFTFEDPAAVAAPFASEENFQMLPGQRLAEVTYDRSDKARLLGLTVSSASTEMVHSEEMHDAGNSLRLGKSSQGVLQVENPTEWDLRHTVVVYRPKPGDTGVGNAKLMGCWIGDLPSRQAATLNFSPLLNSQEGAAPLADRRAPDKGQAAEELNLEPLWGVALDERFFEPGEVRAIARIDGRLDGMAIGPKAPPQQSGATLLVAHLQYDIPEPPLPDANAPTDFVVNK